MNDATGAAGAQPGPPVPGAAPQPSLGRRRQHRRTLVLVVVLMIGVSAGVLLGHRSGRLPATQDAGAEQGRVTARAPSAPPADGRPGLHRLDAVGAPGSLLYAPAQGGRVPRPLIVMFHGAGGAADQGLRLIRRQADAQGVLVLSIKSTGSTWDVVAGGGFGPDIERLDAALAHAFASYPVDPGRVAVGGFSDGASYALSVGLTNGDVFGQVVAFSPGFIAAQRHHGRPRVFVSHGDRDTVLPIAATSRRLVPQLSDEYAVEYVEFPGGHQVPAEIVDRAVRWWLPG